MVSKHQGVRIHKPTPPIVHTARRIHSILWFDVTFNSHIINDGKDWSTSRERGCGGGVMAGDPKQLLVTLYGKLVDITPRYTDSSGFVARQQKFH